MRAINGSLSQRVRREPAFAIPGCRGLIRIPGVSKPFASKVGASPELIIIGAAQQWSFRRTKYADAFKGRRDLRDLKKINCLGENDGGFGSEAVSLWRHLPLPQH
jgi:hypothetical protein